MRRFFDEFGETRCSRLRFVCSNIWKTYLRVIAQKGRQAMHILERFHITSHTNKIRATDVKDLKNKRKSLVLTEPRWCLLKRPENFTQK